jgi:hypothetical protein
MPEEHNCAINYVAEGIKGLSANLVKVVKKKISDIE